jgi:acetyltransferase-like isoleucine patch superfamily enzyme/RimJ/RimL family protein N-acetyltransferase
MLIDIGEEAYYKIFTIDPHPFLSQKFLELNKSKVERVLYLVNDNSKTSIGLVVGLKHGFLLSPFTAPFGGFHFSHQILYIEIINSFIQDLQLYIISNNFNGINITLPPNIYHQTINSKLVNCLYYSGFSIKSLDITSWVDLNLFENRYRIKSSREHLNQAYKYDLVFNLISQKEKKLEAYELIMLNRKRRNRPIYMTFSDLEKLNGILDIDFFEVSNKNNEMLASAIIYRTHKSIVYIVFWGDNEKGRPLRAMDFCIFNLLNYYKQDGYNFLDIGISTENGVPNEGLLRFKETHEAISSVRYTLNWTYDHGLKMTSGINKSTMDIINKYGIFLRLVEIEDAEFILKLRNNPDLNKFISPTSSSLVEQSRWIQNYKINERKGLEYYFIVSDQLGNKYGTIRLYNWDGESFEIGSWLFLKNSPLGMAVKAHILGYEIGFEKFNTELCRFEIRKENKNVLKYVEFFKPEITKIDEINVYFKLSKENFYKRKNKLSIFTSVNKSHDNKITIHPTAEVKTKMIGEGTSIWQYCVVLEKAIIGKNCNLNYNVFVENDVIIGDNVTVKSGVQLWDGIRLENNTFISPNVTFTNDFTPRSKQYPVKFLTTHVKEGASIGANSTIIGGITVGKYSMVGAGSVVTKNIPDYTLWYGVPAIFKAYICKCGQKLDNLLTCPGCNTSYQLSNGTISEL